MPKTTATTEDDLKVEVLEEQLRVGKRTVDRGRVLIETKVATTDHVVEALLRQDEVMVQRVPVDRVVPEVPVIREEDGVLIVPVVEERLEVRTVLVLKEELRIAKTTSEQLVRRTVPLRAEQATVTRLDESPSSHCHERDLP
jgi:uncharacterized protein (TIGR02271 family)